MTKTFNFIVFVMKFHSITNEFCKINNLFKVYELLVLGPKVKQSVQSSKVDQNFKLKR